MKASYLYLILAAIFIAAWAVTLNAQIFLGVAGFIFLWLSWLLDYGDRKGWDNKQSNDEEDY